VSGGCPTANRERTECTNCGEKTSLIGMKRVRVAGGERVHGVEATSRGGTNRIGAALKVSSGDSMFGGGLELAEFPKIDIHC